MAARLKAQMDRDRKNISALYLAGDTQAEIGEKLKLSQPTVSRDLKHIRKQWMKETTFNIDQAKGAELARIDKLEVEYWAAWKRSKELVPQKIKDKSGVERTIYRAFSNKAPFGSVSYLNGVHKCIDQRRAILGLDAPKRNEHTGPDGKPIQIDNIGITDAERANRITELLDSAREERDRQTSGG